MLSDMALLQAPPRISLLSSPPASSGGTATGRFLLAVGGGLGALLCWGLWRRYSRGLLPISRNSNLRSRWDRTFLQHVVQGNGQQVARDTALLEANAAYGYNLPLHIACCCIEADTDILITSLLRNGAKNEGAYFSRPWIWWELGFHHPIPRGVMTLLCDGRRQTPLHRLLRQGRNQFEIQPIFSLSALEKCLRALCEAGGSQGVNEADSEGRVPLALAAEKTRQRSERFNHVAVSVLLSHPGIEINKAVNDSGATLLHVLCARAGTTPDPQVLQQCIATLLMHPQLHVNAEDYHGNTSLHCLVAGFLSVVTPSPTESLEDHKARWSILRALLKRGANPSLPNKEHVQAYQMASEAHLSELCGVLKGAVDDEKWNMRDVEVLDSGDVA